VILDIMLPKRSGFEVVTAIRSKKPRLPVIMLTAQGEVDSRITGLDKGADDYMGKPSLSVNYPPGSEPCCDEARRRTQS